MPNSKAKGRRYETDVVDYLTARGWSADRMDQRVANNDKPDVLALFEVTPWTAAVLKIEGKNRRAPTVGLLAGALQQAVSTKGAGLPVACIKLAGKNVRESLAVVRLEDLLALVEKLGGQQ